MTNASFKQGVEIFLMPKIDKAHKNYLTPEIWEEMYLRDIFCCTSSFQQSSMISIDHHVGIEAKLLLACILLNIWELRLHMQLTLPQQLFNIFLEV